MRLNSKYYENNVESLCEQSRNFTRIKLRHYSRKVVMFFSCNKFFLLKFFFSKATPFLSQIYECIFKI